jgi:RNA polymerase sigma-70 factor (ECF subfamily)
VQGERTAPDPDLDLQREVVGAFLAAAREGDFDALVAVLDPDVVLRADFGGGVTQELRGAEAVASQAQAYSRLDLVIHPALINGAVGSVVTRDGRPFSVSAVTVLGGKIVELDFLSDPERLAQLDLTVLDG